MSEWGNEDRYVLLLVQKRVENAIMYFMENTTTNTYIYGKHPVEEMLSTSPKKVQKIFIKKDSRGQSFDVIKNLASKNKIPVSFIDTQRIKEMAGEKAVVQRVAAMVGDVDFMELDEFLKGLDMDTKPAVILLDEIEDPHNVGAIIRSVSAAGLSGVILGKHRQAPITSTVFKVSAGTAGKIPLVRVSNLNSSIEKLKKAGFWTVALDQNAKSDIWHADFDMPICFILGNEGKGVREKTLEKADFVYSIPMRNKVESLNVSVSAALVAYEWLRRKI